MKTIVLILLVISAAANIILGLRDRRKLASLENKNGQPSPPV